MPKLLSAGSSKLFPTGPSPGLSWAKSCRLSLVSAKRWDLAERQALAALKMEGPSASLFHDLGLALDNQGRFDSARAAYSMAAQLDPRFVPALRTFNRRRLIPTAGIPAGIATAAG